MYRDNSIPESCFPQSLEAGPAPDLACADLFAGAGGFSLAATLADIRVKVAIENDRHAANTYRQNFCNTQFKPLFLENNIASLSPLAVRERAFKNGESCDLILGGPPCQGFSAHRIKDAGVEDTRNGLIHTYFDFVDAFKPTVFLMENVPGMLWPRHRGYVDQFYRKGRESGYFIYDPVVIDARDFGVPQRRKRVFILGIAVDIDRSGFEWPPKSSHGSEARRREEPTLQPWENCGFAFQEAPLGDPNDRHMTHSAEIVRAFINTPANGGSRRDSGRVLKCHRDHDGHKDVYGRIDPGRPAPTMTTACINPSKGRFVHPEKHHGITAREAARIQTFPDKFIFSGGLMAAGQQIGNAVPIKLGYALLTHIKPMLVQAKMAMHFQMPASDRS